MGRKMINAARVAVVCAVLLGASGSALEPVGATAPFTVCYDRSTRLMHFSPLGRCYKPRQITLVVGGAASGPRGQRGVPGAAGIQGNTGFIGPIGIQGPQGAQGAPGETGQQGAPGTNGGTGTDGGTGPIGGTGQQGAPGTNAAVKVSQSETLAADTLSTLTVTCPAGQIATGGGFHGTNEAFIASEPTPLGNGWRASYRSDGTVFSVSVICIVGTSSSLA